MNRSSWNGLAALLLFFSPCFQSGCRAEEQSKLIPNTTSTWQGTMTQAGLKTLGNKNTGETVSFTVTSDAAGAPTAINLTFTGHTATLDGNNQLVCYSGGLASKSASVGSSFIFPSGDGYFGTFSNGDPGNGVFFNGVNGQVYVEGDAVDPNTGMTINLADNEAQGAVNFQYVFDLEPGQNCTGGSLSGGTCSLPCSFFWTAQCVSNCSGNGNISVEFSSYSVDETAGSVSIRVLRTQGLAGSVSVDYTTTVSTAGNAATAGADYTTTTGTLSWADQDAAAQTVSIPILQDTQIEGEEVFLFTLSNPQGGAQLGTAQAQVLIDDRPDLVVDSITADPNALVQAGNSYTLPAVEVVVRNAAAGGQTVTSSQLEVSDNSGVVHAVAVGPLAPGQSQTLQFDYDMTALITSGQGLVSNNSLVAVIDPGGQIQERDESNNQQTTPANVDVRPVVTSLDPEYTLDNAFYLSGVPVSNTVQAGVDWNGPNLAGTGSAPYGNVSFVLNGVETLVAGTATGGSKLYDMGTEFNQVNACNANELLAQAQINGFLSDTLARNTTVFEVPAWVDWIVANIPGSSTQFGARLAAPLVTYLFDFFYPEPAFEARLLVPAEVPYFGGEELGILPSQANAHIEVQSSGQGLIKLAGQTGLSLASFQITGELFGQGNLAFQCASGLELQSTTFGVLITGQINREQPLLEVFPGVATAQNLPLVGKLVKWITDAAVISGSLGASIDLAATFAPDQTGALVFDSGTGQGSIPVSATLTVSPFDNVELSLTGGGEPYITVNFPAPYLDQIGIRLLLAAVLDIYGYGDSYETVVDCVLPGTCTVDQSGTQKGATALRLLPRRHFPGPKAVFAPKTLQATGGAGDQETVLVSNTYAQANLSLAGSSSGKLAVAYLHDDPNDPLGHNRDVRVLFHDGSNWLAPMDVNNDQMADFSPRVAYDGSDTPVLVWEKSTLPTNITPGSFDLTFAQSLEIFTSTYNGTAWTTPVQVTSNSLMDHDLKLVKGADGNLMLVWRSHSGNNLAGDATNPVSFKYALWQGNAWSAESTIFAAGSEILATAVAMRSATEAAMVYMKAASSLGNTTTELYYTLFNGTGWSTPVAITSDNLADESPQLAYDSSGALHLIWRRGGSIVWLKNSFDITQVQTIRSASQSAGFMDMQLLADSAGGLALLWHSAAGAGNDLAYSILDTSTNTWGLEQRLQNDLAAESAIAGLLGSGGLQLAYAKTAMTRADQSVTTAGTGTFTVPNVPVAGATDLVYLQHGLGLDVRVDAVTVSPGNLFPDGDYQATVYYSNSGDYSVSNVVLELTHNGQLIGSETIINLAAGEQRQFVVNGNLGSNLQQEFMATIDPGNAVAEKDESNNSRRTRLTSGGFDYLFQHGFE